MKPVSKAALCEVRRLLCPPQDVKNTLAATLLLLRKGERCNLCPTYADVLKALNRSSILTRMQTLDVNEIPLEVALGALLLMKTFSKERLMCSSFAACEIYKWNVSVTEAVLAQYDEEEISQTVPCIIPQKVW